MATTNPAKCREMLQILAPLLPGLTLLTLSDFPPRPDVDESGSSFEENAILKAVAASTATGRASIADDGGLEIDALGGLPGVQSHRFLGADTSFAVKNRRVLEMLEPVQEPERTCRYRCAVALATPWQSPVVVTGVCEGTIGLEPRGTNGFGFDPIFRLPDGRHMAELSAHEKHALSHRGAALRAIVPVVRRLVEAHAPPGETGNA